ncbi:hypothetical protein [Candidatus Parabeggiatoa sp. HSG14]|uniref:hypothetical protein n=1 Tax=Candidatus Parabeggiatoa sp. HSG14 TaxID=3055593 RepID=UPI0025A7E504|nr:hypothetical protein [Thiotrichales bacterium HSG14]
MQTKIAIFVEGQGEQIFLRNILFHLYDNSLLSFECVKFHGGENKYVPYPFGNKQTSKIHFLIVNVENDEKVLIVIKNMEENLIKKGGYSKIIGLRDMYSRIYRTKSNGKIDDEISKQFIETYNSEINKMSTPDKISFYFSIMEIESWWLSMFTLFKKIDSSLTVDAINEKFGFKLDEIDPERYFFHPANDLKSILESVGKSYDKKRGDVESITTHITLQDIDAGISNNRCGTLRAFYEELCSFRTV